MAGVTDLLQPLVAYSSPVVLPTGGQPRSRAEIVAANMGGIAGAEVMLQKLLEIRGKMGGADQARAEQEAPFREFKEPPVTYDGFAAVRRPPTSSIFLVA